MGGIARVPLPRSPSSARRITGAVWPGNIASLGSNIVARLSETRKNLAIMFALFVEGVEVAHARNLMAAAAHRKRLSTFSMSTMPAAHCSGVLARTSQFVVRPSSQSTIAISPPCWAICFSKL